MESDPIAEDKKAAARVHRVFSWAEEDIKGSIEDWFRRNTYYVAFCVVAAVVFEGILLWHGVGGESFIYVLALLFWLSIIGYSSFDHDPIPGVFLKRFAKANGFSYSPSGAGKGDKGEAQSDPDEVFKGAYENAEKKVMNAVPIEEVEKAFKDWKEGGGDPLERADREYAAKLGVKKEELDRYRNIVRSLEDMKNPETNQSVIEELRMLIERIIARRLKPVPAPRYPMEEGEDLVEAGQLVSDVKSGNLEPRVWETTETRERPGKKFGEVEITLVCDRSGSMSGSKLSEQRKAAVLLMEALREFAERCEEERTNVDKPLEVRSEVYSFQSSSEDATPLKKMSKELGEKERIEVATTLSSVEGSTTDFIPLETIEKRIDADSRKKITDGELKKIVVVFTDGESDDPGRVRKILQKLREQGVVAIGVGITEDGKAALTTYAPDAKLAEKAEQLGKTLGELLQEHLEDI